MGSNGDSFVRGSGIRNRIRAAPASSPTAAPLILLALAAVLILPQALYNPMASFDEAWYASIARNILERRDWLTLYFNGAPWWDRSPVGLWPTALSFLVLGVTDIAARLPAVLFGLGCVLLVYRWGREEGGSALGLLAGLLLLTAQDFVRFAAKGQLDTIVTFAIVANVFLFWKGLERPALHLAAGLFLGLGLAAKNEHAALGPIIQMAYIAAGRDFRPLRQWQWYVSPLLGVAMALPWIVHQYLTHGRPFLTQFYFINWQLFAQKQTVLTDHLFYPWYLARRHGVLLTLTLAGIAWAVFQHIRRGDRLPLFLAMWVGVAPLPYAYMGATNYWYLIPMYPGAALLVALALAHTSWWQTKRSLVLAGVAAWAVVWIASFYLPRPQETELRATKAMAPAVRAATAPDEPVYLLHSSSHEVADIHAPAAHYYFDRVVVYVRSVEELAQVLAQRRPVVLVGRDGTFQGAYGGLLPGGRMRGVAASRGYSARLYLPSSGSPSE